MKPHVHDIKNLSFKTFLHLGKDINGSVSFRTKINVFSGEQTESFRLQKLIAFSKFKNKSEKNENIRLNTRIGFLEFYEI